MTKLQQSRLKTFVETTDIFKDISVESQNELIQQANVKAYDANQIIFSEGDPSSRLYFIIDGQVSIEIYSDEGQVLVLATLQGGEILGQFGVIDGLPRSATARTINKTLIASISGPHFQRIRAGNRSVEQAILKKLISVIRQSNLTVEDLVLNPLNLRVINALKLEMYNVLKTGEGSDKNVCIKITQSRLADRVSASREKVNKCLKNLEKENIIKRGHKKIYIINIAKLIHLSTATLYDKVGDGDIGKSM